MSKPMIGISTYFVRAFEFGDNRVRGQIDQDMIMSTWDYSAAVELAGGIPVTIPSYTDDECIDEIAKRLDGFILAGGPDVDPLLYADYVAKNVSTVIPERDRFELLLLEKIVKYNKPVLGICRGMQLMNVYFKGSLDQDEFVANTNLSHTGKKIPRFAPRHGLTIEEDSRLGRIFGQTEIAVNSYHHQVVKDLGKELSATAWAQDGCIEGIEHNEHDFTIGVQWHPEMMAHKHELQLKIFKALIDSSKCK